MHIPSETINWLLEEDNPSIRYATLRNIKDSHPTPTKVNQAKQLAYKEGAIAKILSKMKPEGYWVKPGPGYSPKYRGTVWSLIALAQLGASVNDDERVKIACNYYLDHALSPNGQFSFNNSPSGTIDCLQGNMCAALTELDCRDPRLGKAYDWLARSITGEGVTEYFTYKCGPNFACKVNGGKPCAWGAAKAMLALSKIAKSKRTPQITKAINTGIEFLLGVDPITAEYPTRDNTKPSSSWWEFGFPVFYVADLLQILEAMVDLGYGNDPRLRNLIRYVKDKAIKDDTWILEYDFKGKTWNNFGKKNEPNKWVTYRAVNVLQKL